ncbi:MAG: fumarate reductase (CoM/CoB) subunit TfrB [Candidatus Methanofastidiosia archaeon]
MVVFKVYRHDPKEDEKERYEFYDVPYQQGMRILDALHYIHDNIDGTLSYRWICRAGQCGTCAILVNGRASLACQEEVDDTQDAVTLEPLFLFPVIKDLVVDLSKGYEKLYASMPYLQRGAPYCKSENVAPEDIVEIKRFRECIECWCCVASCPVVNQVWEDYFGPIVMCKLAELNLDMRDVGERLDTALNEGLYHCTTCRNCWTVCPQEIEIPEKAIEQMRARAVKAGKAPLKSHKQLVRSIENYKNPWIMPRSKRAKWAKGLNLNDHGEVMFYAGCSPSFLFGDRLPLNIIMVLRRLGIEPAYLGKEELCCGSPLLKIGARDAYDEIALANIKLMKERGVDTLITTCAGCHKSWAVDYKEFFGDFDITIKHVTEILWEALQEERLRFKDLPKNHVKITYHDPCHLGRGSGIYEAPRRLIQAIPGMHLIEPIRTRENSYCCGSGGGVKTAKPDVALKVGGERVHTFEDMGANYIISCCPWCEQHLDDSIAYSHAKIGPTRDLIEIIEETMVCDNIE